jgi:hypothetical protein
MRGVAVLQVPDNKRTVAVIELVPRLSVPLGEIPARGTAAEQDVLALALEGNAGLEEAVNDDRFVERE